MFAVPFVTPLPLMNSATSLTWRAPPLSLVISLIIVSCGAISSFVIVQVMFSPSSSTVTFAPKSDEHFASPEISIKEYPTRPTSSKAMPSSLESTASV